MKKVLFDTDVLIDFLRGNKVAVDYFESFKESDQTAISSITVAELFAGARSKKEQEDIKGFIRVFSTFDLTSEIAELAGEFKSFYGKSHGLGLADAVIAATCQMHHLELLTLNIKHYPMLKNLRPAYKK